MQITIMLKLSDINSGICTICFVTSRYVYNLHVYKISVVHELPPSD